MSLYRDKIDIRFFCIVLFLLTCCKLLAFKTSTYTDESVLNSGNWLKISVESTGVHFIPMQELKKWGFPSAENVKIYGYGGKMLSDYLVEKEYIDDLPEVPILVTEKGVYFYAVGPVNFELNEKGLYERSVNPYSNYGYYYITGTDENSPAKTIEKQGIPTISPSSRNVFMQALLHEVDAVNYGATGRVFLGEDFRTVPSRSFSFSLEGIQKESEVNVKCVFGSKTTSDSYLGFSANGNSIAGFEKVPMPYTIGSNYGTLKTYEMNVPVSDTKLNLGIIFTGGGIIRAANLDYILINYQSEIEVPSRGSVIFDSDVAEISITDKYSDSHIWDVSDPLSTTELNVGYEDKNIGFVSLASGNRRYCAWNEQSVLPTPKLMGKIENQNLHDVSTRPEMVIFTTSSLKKYAEELAGIHRDIDGMNVSVITQQSVFNEFSSGSPDPSAFRKYLKMLYDRDNQSLKYALFLGRGSYDNRGLETKQNDTGEFTMPIWESEESMSETVSYTTDDLFSQLEDNAGLRPESDRYCIAVGRIPARSTAEAGAFISKLKSYISQKNDNNWINRVIILADDGDNGTHLLQAEDEVTKFQSKTLGSSKLYEKIYLDAYSLKGGVCQEAREKLLQYLDKGVLWWNYNGHANKYYLTGQGVLTLNDIDNLRNKHLPVFFGATCYFMQWDNTEQSGAEKLFFNQNGGIISAITATRPVFISENAQMASCIAEQAFAIDENDMNQPIGISLMKAKNQLASPGGKSNSNKLRYGLMGDPAMRLAGMANKITIDSINSMPFETGKEFVMEGRSRYKLTGRVTGSQGGLNESFNGSINIEFYDADKSITTKGRDIDGTSGKQLTYDSHGDLLYVGGDSVKNGTWSMEIVLPEDIADNYRPSSLQLSAFSDQTTASTMIRNIYVSGLNDEFQEDTISPTITYIYLNDSSFKNGDRVNSTPVLFVGVTDDNGINLSTTGLGREMIIRIDNRTLNDVTMYYTPYQNGEIGGSIAYPLGELSEGKHTLLYRVSDIFGNIAEEEIMFVVDNNLAPEIFDVYTDENPASSTVNFYLVHNRPDTRLSITICVYSLSGNLVWSSTINDRSDNIVSSPISWNLIDRGGQRVARGIYIYRAEVRSGNTKVVSPARRLAVTGR